MINLYIYLKTLHVKDIVVKTPLCGQASLLMFPDVRLLTPFSRIQQITPSHFNLSFNWWRTKKYSWIHLKSRFILRMFCRVMGERKIVFFILVQGIMFTKHASCTNSALFKTRENTRLNGHVVKQFLSPSLMSCNHWCLRNSWCTSTNFREPSEVNKKGIFELNKYGYINQKTNLDDEKGVTFSLLVKVHSSLV